MSIIDTFDLESEEIIKAVNYVEEVRNFPKTIICAFTVDFTKLIKNNYHPCEIAHLNAGGEGIPVYKIEYKGKTFGFYQTLLGGAAAASLLEEIIALGGEKILYFGSCGVLDRSIADGHLLIPTAAYRDEGVSYHYAKASDYIHINTADQLAKAFEDLEIPYFKTKTWTTDAFYRETKGNMEKRKGEGCGVVEMECASVMAVGQFRDKEVFQFLYTADCLDGGYWDKGDLGQLPEKSNEKLFRIAIEIAERI